MSNLTLITGGPGSGKTDEVVSRLAALYQADPFFEAVVLVPTVRHGDQFRRRLVGRCGVALRLRVETIPQYSRQLAAEVWVPSYTLVEELLARTTRREAEHGPASYFQPIAGTRGFNDLLNAAINDLLAEAIDPQTLLEAAEESGSPGLTALAAIFTAYCPELEDRRLLHPEQITLAAAAAVQSGVALSPTVMLDGFQLFRGSELTLLETLANRSEVIVTLDSEAGARARHDYERLISRFPHAKAVEVQRDPGTRPLTVIAGDAADREGQLRAIARWIKQRLTDDPSLRPSDCAVTFRQVSPYLSLARQVFEEYDLPFDPAAGERLNARPLGVWLRRLLHLAQDGWHLQDVVGVLSSGFADLSRWQLSTGRVAQFASRGREANLWAGQDALGRIIESLRTDADASTGPDSTREMLRRTADSIAIALEELTGLLDRPPSPVAEHARHLDEALFGPQALVIPSSRELPGVDVEIDALRGYLQDLASTFEDLGSEPEPFESFVRRLERKLDTPAVLLREAGGVLLAPMHTLHGLRFDFAVVGGLIEGEFPAPQTSTALLDSDARDALNKNGLTLPPEPRLAEDELWASVNTRADSTLGLWKTRLDERGRPAAPSYYFDSLTPNEVVEERATLPGHTASRRELAIACSQQWLTLGRLRPEGAAAWPIVRSAVLTEQLRRSFRHAGAYEGRLATDLVPGLTNRDAVWSATRLESYRTCAFQFFSQYALRLRELDQELDSADAAIRGSVIHSILHDALEPLVAEGRPLTPDTLNEAVARLRANGPDIWNRAPQELGFGRAALWRLDGEAILEQIELLLQREAYNSVRSGVARVIGAEKQIEASLPLDPPMRVAATVDRLDAGEDLIVIVDYKSGREIPRSHVVDGRRVQLQLYSYLAREETQAGRVIARYAWLDPAMRQWDINSSRPEDASVIDDVVAVAQEVRNSVESGDFRVNPQVQTCPTYCSFHHICRVNEFSRWKRWD
jgi:RecB family exonuclease